jgi:hypothetical protein
MEMKKVVLASALMGLLAGCAQGARVEQMSAAPTTALPSGSALQHAVQINGVSGGTETNPLWMSKVGNAEFQSALQSSLGAAGLLANGQGRYQLNAKLEALHQPFAGFDLTVHSQVRYNLTDLTTNKPIFDRQIDADYTATVGDAFIAVERLRLANEGSIKKNIQTFMDQLIADFGKGPTVSATSLSSGTGG